MSAYWKLVSLEEDTSVVFVGVHVLRWQSEWGEPTVAFDRAEELDEELETLRSRIAELEKAVEEAKRTIGFYRNLETGEPSRVNDPSFAKDWLKEYGGKK